MEKQAMAAMIAAVDDGVGEIIRTLKEEGLYENTILFFSSEVETRNWLDGTTDLYYGGSAGLLRGHKASLFDGGIKEPAIFAFPGMLPGGKTVGEVGVMMDVVPTLLRLTNVGAPDDFDGEDVWAMAAEGAPSPHESVFWLAVRSGKWKLVLNGKLDFDRKVPETVFLCDLEGDPGGQSIWRTVIRSSWRS